MVSKDDAVRALDAVPAWSGADVSKLDGGHSDAAWLIERDGIRAVLKLDEAPRSAPFNTRLVEASIQARAFDSGIGSRVLHADEQMLLSEYVEGAPWGTQENDDADELHALAMALRQVHALPLTGRQFDALTAAKQYLKGIGDADEEIAERCLRTIRETPMPVRPSCCHNDLVPANILVGNGIRLIDWEYACDNDPLFDLATVVVELNLNSADVSRMLDVYFDGDGARWLPDLARQQRLYEALTWLWRESEGRI